MNNKHQKGSASEFAACKYLSEQGYYIFLRSSVTSPIDIVAIDPKTNEILLIDVKSVSLRKSGDKKGHRINRVLSEEQKKMGVKLLYCYDDGSFKYQN